VQIIGDMKTPFDDRVVTREILQERAREQAHDWPRRRTA